jgi:hypothetical protein
LIKSVMFLMVVFWWFHLWGGQPGISHRDFSLDIDHTNEQLGELMRTKAEPLNRIEF